jgi:hypothetical protein
MIRDGEHILVRFGASLRHRRHTQY